MGIRIGNKNFVNVLLGVISKGFIFVYILVLRFVNFSDGRKSVMYWLLVESKYCIL